MRSDFWAIEQQCYALETIIQNLFHSIAYKKAKKIE